MKSLCVCGQEKERQDVACRACWALVPRNLRGKILALHRNSATRGGREHRAAVREALRYIRANLRGSKEVA